jgi:hypothetical protein
MLLLIAALLAVLLLVVIAAVVVFLDYARRGMTALRRIEAHAETDSNETLPAIRGALGDVVDVLIPPGGGR